MTDDRTRPLSTPPLSPPRLWLRHAGAWGLRTVTSITRACPPRAVPTCAPRLPLINEVFSGPLEYIVDAPKARVLARKRLSSAARGYLESLCE